MQKFEPSFIDEQKKRLLLEKNRLNKDLKNLEKFPQYGDQIEDNSDEVEEFTINQSQEKNLNLLMQDIDKALLKIDNNSYGICEECKKIIDRKRLIAFPAATKCLNCENK